MGSFAIESVGGQNHAPSLLDIERRLNIPGTLLRAA
jgi:hypothetical protein